MKRPTLTTTPATLVPAPGRLRFPATAGQRLRAGTIDAETLRAALREVAGDPTDCLSWLEGLLADGPALAAVTRRSYWHPNHFAKLVLHAPDDGAFRIRLHVWPEDLAGPRLGESNPHSHRWEFASTVLAGAGLDMIEYAETDRGGTPFTRYRYGGDPSDPAALRCDGSARLATVRTPKARQGTSYSCDTSVIHTVAPVGRRLVATLVYQGPHRSDSTVVYREPGLGAEQPNRPIRESEVYGLVRAVLAARRGPGARG